MTNNELKTICAGIENEIWDKYVDENGKADPIIDGIVDVDIYVQTKPKILWILKEPYDEEEDGLASGGGWHFSRDFLAKADFYKRMGRSRNTWHPIIYTSYGLIKDFMDYNDMNYIRDDLSMVEVVKQIAVINVKKLPGFTRTYNFGPIWNSYHKNKALLHKQIKSYDPDIIIGGSTLHLFYNDLEIMQENIQKFGSIDTTVKENKLFIAAYHPAQTQVTREVYVNDIINVSRDFWSSR